ncbi:MAG: hypothetical protein JSV25_06530 [Spirochaetota bacterium]|nr:MAG: hypothetical protein JSV25_06530 [Spirochaetota bacterium]
MKKVILFTASITMFLFFFPLHLLAQEKKAEDYKWLGKVKLGSQILGNHKTVYQDSFYSIDTMIGVSSGAEFFYALHENINVGVGFEYQIPREQNQNPGGFNFLPIFAVIRFPFSLELFEPYAIGRFGFNFFFGDDQYRGTGAGNSNLEGGIYYSIGSGVSIPGISFSILNIPLNPFLEVNYSVNHGSGIIQDSQQEVIYTSLSLYIGVESRF